MLRRLTLAVGEALGMDVYGVDVVVSAGEHYVVDVSAFPGFKGCPRRRAAPRRAGSWRRQDVRCQSVDGGAGGI